MSLPTLSEQTASHDADEITYAGSIASPLEDLK
jgi:hypothetical protein